MTNLKITKPFEGWKYHGDVNKVPCWFFEGVDVPDIDFDSLKWKSKQGDFLQGSETFALRYEVEDMSDALQRTLRDLTVSVISEIRENHSENMGIDILYPIFPWNLTAKVALKKDMKRFHMGKHLDNRNSRFTFIMNLTDNLDGTTFHTENFAEPYNEYDPVFGPTKKGSGVFYFNHHTLIHDIGPIKSEERYILFHQQYMN
jgi:hypothetical protein